MLALVLVAAAYGAVAGGRQLLADRAFHPIRVPAPTAAPAAAASALAAATSVPTSGATPAAPLPTGAGIARALAGPLTDPELGPQVVAQVADAATGQPLFAQRPDVSVAPASTAKLLTAAAVLLTRRATDRFSTRVLAGSAPGTVVLVGGGDPTLSAAAAGEPTEYAGAARVSALAAAVRKSLGGQAVTAVEVDGSLFTGPSTAAGWGSGDAPSSYASPITAIMVDAGRDAPGAAIRSAAPDLAAGNALAAALGGATVTRGTAAAGARVLGAVQSAPVGRLVEQMLSDSDNVMAEVLARQVALATGRPASFTDAAAAVATTLAPLGVSAGAGMRDGSGLSELDRLPAGALLKTLLAATGTAHPQLRPILSGLSVAGWDGTLTEQNRFTGAAGSAVGVIRAKTGSLTGVSGLAGVVTDRDGRQLAFVFVADQAPTEGPTRTAIDTLAATLAGCGCR